MDDDWARTDDDLIVEAVLVRVIVQNLLLKARGVNLSRGELEAQLTRLMAHVEEIESLANQRVAPMHAPDVRSDSVPIARGSEQAADARDTSVLVPIASGGEDILNATPGKDPSTNGSAS